MKKLLLVIILLLAIIPFFWLKPGEVNLGGDSSRLYFYDPFHYLLNFPIYSILPSETGSENISYYWIPFTLLLLFLKTIIRSPYLLITLIHSFMLVASFYFTYLSIYTLLRNGNREDKIELHVAAILGGLFYALTPVLGFNWDKATARHHQLFLSPFMFFLLLQFFQTHKISYALMALLTTFVFSINFSFATAANVFAFYPFAIAFILLYTHIVRKFQLPWRKIAVVIFLSLGIHVFHLLPQFLAFFDKSSTEFHLVFSSKGVNEALSYFTGSSHGIKLVNNLGALSQGVQLFPFDFFLFVFPLLLILALLLNSFSKKEISFRKNFLALLSIFLIVAFFTTANVTTLGFELYKSLFQIPGFGMFKNYYGQFMYSFYFFYALVFAYAFYYVLIFLKEDRRPTVIATLFLLIVVNGWPFIKGDMVNLPIYQSKNVNVPFKMDPDFEKVLTYIRGIPHEGKFLTLPIADFGYQLVSGTEGGVYIGPSMIGYLTGKPDFSGYVGFAPFADVFLKLAKEKDIQSLKNLFALYNIGYIYYNEDPYIFDNFPRFPYETTRKALPSHNAYREFLQSLDTQEVFARDTYHLYKLPDSDYFPHIYIAKNLLNIPSAEDLEHALPLYSFAQDHLAVTHLPGDDTIIRAQKVDIFKRIIKDYPIPVLYPFAKWKLDSPVYPLVVLKEKRRIGCPYATSDKGIGCDLFYSTKRISEFGRWEGGIPVLGSVAGREQLSRDWQEPSIFDFKRWHTYNSWEASLLRYITGVENEMQRLANHGKGLAWEIEKKSEITEILLDNERILNLIIKNSPKPAKDKVYVKRLLDEIFAYYLARVNASSYDASVLEYGISAVETPSAYEISVKEPDDGEIKSEELVLTFGNKEYKPLSSGDNGWLNFGQVNLPNHESLLTIKIPRINLAEDSVWKAGSSAYTISESEIIRLETARRDLEGFTTRVDNISSPGHYLLSFDYLTYGESFEFRLFLPEKNDTRDVKETQLFHEGKLSDGWKSMNAVLDIGKPSHIIVQIKPTGEIVLNRRIDVKNVSLVKLPPHPEVILRKLEPPRAAEQPPHITFDKVNPTKYKVNIQRAINPYVLVFSQAYNKKWKLIDATRDNDSFQAGVERFLGKLGLLIVRALHINTAFLNEDTFITWGKRVVAQDRHMLVNGYANGWQILPQDLEGSDYELVLEITSQRGFYMSLLPSMGILMATVGWLLIYTRKNRDKKL